MPPLRLGSLADCVRDIGVGGGGVLAVLVRRSEGLLDRKPRLDSRVEVCLWLISGIESHGVEVRTCLILTRLFYDPK